MSLANYRSSIFGHKLAGRAAVLSACAVLIAACGGGGDEAAAPLGANPPGNQSPTISGTPSASVMQSNPYSFTPTASDPDGGTLTFSIANMPQWAAFNTATGALTGTPTAGNVGSYQNIQISVSDGQGDSANLASFGINVVATAMGAATLSWTPPTQNTDGSPLTLAGYKIYWGTTQGSYTNFKPVTAGVTSAMVDQLTPAQYYFVITALDGQGTESGYSNVATKTVL